MRNLLSLLFVAVLLVVVGCTNNEASRQFVADGEMGKVIEEGGWYTVYEKVVGDTVTKKTVYYESADDYDQQTDVVICVANKIIKSYTKQYKDGDLVRLIPHQHLVGREYK